MRLTRLFLLNPVILVPLDPRCYPTPDTLLCLGNVDSETVARRGQIDFRIAKDPFSLSAHCYERQPRGLGACLGGAAFAQTWRTRDVFLYLVALLPLSSFFRFVVLVSGHFYGSL
jgi:hypothetical protein